MDEDIARWKRKLREMTSHFRQFPDDAPERKVLLKHIGSVAAHIAALKRRRAKE
jgi:hypothetical protein